MRNLPKHYLGYYIQIKWAAISRAQFVEGLGKRNVPGRSEKKYFVSYRIDKPREIGGGGTDARGRLNIKMPSYKNIYPHYKDKVSRTFYLYIANPIFGKTVFILKQDPDGNSNASGLIYILADGLRITATIMSSPNWFMCPTWQTSHPYVI